MTNVNDKQKSYAAALFAILFWSSAFPAVKYCLDSYSPESIMLFRFLVASATLAVFALFKGIKPPRKKDILLFASCGFVGIFLYMWAFNTGTSLVSSGISSFIIAFAPAITLVLSILILKEKAGFNTWLGVAISCTGLVIVAYGKSAKFELNLGIVILTGAAFCTAAYNILQRQLLKRYSPTEAISYCVWFATMFMLVFLPKLAAEFPGKPLGVNLTIVYLGVFPAAVSYFLWSFALSKAEKTVHVTNFLFLSPFSSVLLSYLWLGEHMPVISFAGGIVIIGGMVYSNLVNRRKS